MRRRLVFAAVLGSFILAACSDASRQGPSDGPAFDKGIPCPTTDFPLAQANALIIQLYPAGTSKKNDPRGIALASAKDISEKWSRCKVADPQGKVVTFVATLLTDFNAGILIGGTSSETAALVGQLVNVMYAGVGFGSTFPAPPLPEVPTSGPDYGIGFYTPGNQLLVRTSSHNGAVLIPASGFNEPTTITVYLRPDTPNPFDESGFLVYPPFYEITASNLSNTHYLANGTAVVGFCFDDAILASLSDPAIAHIAVAEGSHPGGFEVPPSASGAQYDQLGLDCDQYAPPVIGSLFDHGLRGFALAAPRVAAHYLRSAAEALLLPSELNASAYFGKIGLGSLPSSLSPFGVTDRNASVPTSNVLDIIEDPSSAYYFPGGSLDTCHDGCEPEVRLVTEADSTPVGAGTNVTVSLVQLAGTTAALNGTLTRPTDGNSSVIFDDLTVSEPGIYQLVFSAPGVKSDTSGSFNVYQLEFQTQPTATVGETITPGDFLGEPVSGFLENVVQVKVVDFSGAAVTDAEQSVFMSLVGPTGATLTGDVNVSPSGGVASFTELTDESSNTVQNGLRVSTGGALINGLQLGAQVYDEPPVLSHTFNVDGRTF
jgi:hypothetical protein